MGRSVTAKHAVITDACREGRGNLGAFEESVRRLREEYKELIGAWPKGKGARLHIKLELERPEED